MFHAVGAYRVVIELNRNTIDGNPIAQYADGIAFQRIIPRHDSGGISMNAEELMIHNRETIAADIYFNSEILYRVFEALRLEVKHQPRVCV